VLPTVLEQLVVVRELAAVRLELELVVLEQTRVVAERLAGLDQV
jgi:hypothetical protein